MDPTEPEPTVVRISTVADVLGVLPHRLGFQPAESIVVICLAGSRSREQLVMRVDLPAHGGERGFARHLADRARHAGATSAIVVCYTDAPRDEPGSGLAREGLVDALVTRLTERGIGVVEALLVRRGRWWSYHCADPACCSGSGSPVPDRLTPAASHYAAESVLSGAVVLADRDELVRSVEPGLHAVAGAAREQALCRAADALAAAAERAGPAGAREVVLRTFDRLAAAWAERGAAPDEDDAALVTLGLHDTRTRDEVMTLVLDHDPGVLVGMLCDLARRTGDDVAAPVCTVLAWAAYADGGGALASVAAERALRVSPGYSMAQLVLDGLSQMVPPSAIREVSRDVRTDLDEVG